MRDERYKRAEKETTHSVTDTQIYPHTYAQIEHSMHILILTLSHAKNHTHKSRGKNRHVHTQFTQITSIHKK